LAGQQQSILLIFLKLGVNKMAWWIDLLTALSEKFGPKAAEWAKSFVGSRKTILVIGAGGVGKTSLGRLLGASMSMLKTTTSYTESTSTETFQVDSEGIKADIIVVTGQEHRRSATWQGQLKDISDGKVDGVILVNAYGYHSIGPLGIKGQKEYKALAAVGEEANFWGEHLKAKREDEIKILQYIAPHVMSRKKPFWLLSLVTKEDLWIDEYDAMRRHYMDEGPYKQQVDAIGASVGNASFRHEFDTLSLFVGDFTTPRGENLARTSPTYSHSKQLESVARFFDLLKGLCQS
jgi:hypothetical protein